MKHYVLLKFEPDYFDEEVFHYLRTTFSRLQSVMADEIFSCRVSKNCVERESNMDVMIELELKDPESLLKYLNHPLHRAVGERMDCHVLSRVSFDRE